MESARLLRFGPFELDVRAAELRKHGIRIRLQDQSFQILLMLLDHPGEVVLREDIRLRLWPNNTVVEFDHSINAAIKRLRNALGEAAEKPVYIETLARRGYRFIGTVETPPAASPPQPPAIFDLAPDEVPKVDPSDLSGVTVSHFRILQKLGSGGMGVVYRAEDLKLGREVALKFLPLPAAEASPQMHERFQREARAASALNHPNICTIYEVEEWSGQPVIVMELLEGQPLNERIGGHPVPIREVLETGIQIAGALDAAHTKGIIHRDIKPANIFLTRQGAAKVLDFGLAKIKSGLVAGEVTATQVTQPGTTMGTLHYMAPEQLMGMEADERSDLFSLGLVLYEMATGLRAFGGQTSAAVQDAILNRYPTPAVRLNPEVPARLEDILNKLLEKDRLLRYQSAAEMGTDLKRLRRELGLESSRRWRWIAAAALVIGIFLAGWSVSRFRQAPAESPVIRLQINPPEGGQFVLGGPANIGGIALSPDGRTAAYVASTNGHTGLWVQPLDGATARLIEGTEGAGYPFWSPDGKSLAFYSGYKLQRVDLAGGTPTPICDTVSGRSGTWSVDGRILFGTLTSGLFQVPASGGTPSPLTTLDASRGELSHQSPQPLSGGRFLFLVRSSENSGIYAASLARPADRVLLMRTSTNAVYARGGDGKGYLMWPRGRTLMAQEFDADSLKLAGEPHPVADPVATNGAAGQMYVAVPSGGTLLYSASNLASQFTWFDRTGKPMGLVGEAGEYTYFRLSSDGRRIVASRAGPGGGGLWLLDVERGVASRFTSDSGLIPVWSPDGRTIVYTSLALRSLLRKEASGAGTEERLTKSANIQAPNDWSRDGRWVLYHEITPGTERDLFVLPVPADSKPAQQATPRSYIRTPFNEGWGRFSPEAPARWVAYQADDTGRFEVYIQAFPVPLGKIRISIGGGQYPQWGAGGRELFYVSPDNKLMAVTLKLAADSFEPATPRELFRLPIVENGRPPYDTTPDGQRFLVRVMPGQAVEPLTVIVNWPTLMKKVEAAR